MSKTVESAQNKVLSKLLRKAAKTEYGKRYGFSKIRDYEAYAQKVPLITYKNIDTCIERMKRGEPNVLWPGKIQNFAVSAGTTGKGKHIPLSHERLYSDQRFMRRVVFNYIKQNPRFITLFFGSHLSLPGRIERPDSRSNVRLGEISGYLAKISPGWLAMFQVRSPHSMTLESWGDKFERTLAKALKSDVRQISTTPFWALQFFHRALEKTGKKYIREIWPNLSLFISGGEALSTYRSHLDHLLDGLDMDYVENYGASESYFAFSDDLKRKDLRLVIDNGCFYEWIPNPSKNRDDLQTQKAVPTWQVEKDVPYGLVVTSNSGLYRYIINDVIRFTDVDSPRIEVIGRVSEVFDQFGEAVESYEARQALDESVEMSGAQISLFTMGGMIDPVIGLPRHYWFIQWVKQPEDLNQFAHLLDENLSSINRHYQIRREVGLEMPVIMNLSNEALNKWFKKHKEVKAQTKIPRILQDQNQISDLVDLCSEGSNAQTAES